MHTVELLEQALTQVRRLGYQVREEWLGGQGGGACELRGQKRLYLDLGQSPQEQLAQVTEVLRAEQPAEGANLPQAADELRERWAA